MNAEAPASRNPPQSTGSSDEVAISDCPACMFAPNQRRPIKEMHPISGIMMTDAIMHPINPMRAVFRSFAALILW